MTRILKFFFLAMAITVSAEVKLAEKGKTEYTIVAPAKANETELAAVKDLQNFLNEITGADFKIGTASQKRIFVGKKAPTDKKTLARYERRAKNDGNDIYIYGWGKFGNAFAVYDFLEHYFGCRWYSFFGDMKIPRRENAIFGRIDYSIIPSFNYFGYYGTQYTQKTRNGADFRRRARIFDLNVKGEPVLFLGSSYPHMLSRVLPSGGVPFFKGEKYNLRGPLKYFKDKKYFETNPEFFSMKPNGRRTWKYQACFSNPELRRTLIENFETVAKNEYQGEPAKMFVDLNDKGKPGMPCCYCKKCTELARKHGHPAGAYWDFLIELCKVFEKKYPDIRLVTLAYQITRNPPTKLVGKLPKNLVVIIAAHGQTDFTKPYSDTPGRTVYNMIRDWGKIAGGDYNHWVAPTVYPRPLWTHPLTANIKRLATNLKDIRKLGVNELDAEFGYHPWADIGFNELRIYILAQLAQNVDYDENILIKDFMENYYGTAAPTMLKYYNELEDCERKEKSFMRNFPDHRTLSYLTPENLLRWQSYFDKMEKTVATDPRRLLNVRRARTNLDEATMSIYYKFKPGTMPDRQKIVKRYKQTLRDSLKDLLRTYEDQSQVEKLSRSRVNKIYHSMYYHYALSGKWKPLPEKFAKLPAGDVLHTAPFINRKILSKEPDAAVGIAVKGQLSEKFSFQLYHWNAPGEQIRQEFEPAITPAMLKKASPGYHLYYIGTSILYSDMWLISNDILHASGVTTGYLFDPKNPKQEYDFYVSLKLEPSGALWFDQLVLVKSGKIPVTQKRPKNL